MNNLLRNALLILALFAVVSCSAQSYVIEFQDDRSAADFVTKSKNAILDIKQIGYNTSIYNVYANALKEDELNQLMKDPSIIHFAKNHEVTTRDIPNDPSYSEQWALPKMQAEEAWSLVNHGITYDNREIVIAILDDSYQIDHPDLINNIWTNEAEIPNDGIDNDQNGYIDDYLGLHVDSRTDNHPIGDHGTKVAGIIGAEGDNSQGITGVNWNIKLMIISGANNSVDIIEGYNYILDQRRLYNQTNGAQGAFVVATNLSAGISDTFGSAFPVWCGMYDKLGKEGIVSVTATDNANYDVDIQGDMPTTCQSEFLITTTSTDRFDSKAMFAAYGPINLDLGSPGESTYSTTDNDEYDRFTGTSAASPHVAGAIGLLYAAQCPLLIEQSLENPMAASQMVKHSILSSVVPLPTLAGISVSGGRLDLFNAMSALAGLCSDTLTDSRETLSFSTIGPNPVTGIIDFQYDFAQFKDHEIKVYNTVGQLMYSQSVSPSLFTTPRASLDVNFLKTGMYLLKFSDGENQVTWKFLKT